MGKSLLRARDSFPHLPPLQGAPTPREAPTPYDAAPTPAFSVPTPGYGLGQQTTAPVGVTRIPNTPGYFSAQTPGVFDSLDDGTSIIPKTRLDPYPHFSQNCPKIGSPNIRINWSETNQYSRSMMKVAGLKVDGLGEVSVFC